MTSSNLTVTFAQYNEDLILRALFYDLKWGFYIDVGANHPVTDSVTKYFYDQGWTGINIEPIHHLYALFTTYRKRDINICAGLGDKKGKAVLREYVDLPGHSTLDSQRKEEKQESLKIKDYEVPIMTLNEVCQKYKVEKIHFLKIDVEGFEGRVIAGNDWQKHRPEVICIEANHTTENWKDRLQAADYFLFISDGLNEYYVASERSERTNDFAERAAALSYMAVKRHHYDQWQNDLKSLSKSEAEVKKLHKELQVALIELDQISKERRVLLELSSLTLKNQGLKRRLKRAAYGLTVDWVKFKRTNPHKSD